MTKPGNKSGQEGGAVPLAGGFEIKSNSSGDYDILTLTAPSTMDAKYLVCRANIAEGATGGDDQFSISSGKVMNFRGFASTSMSTAVASTQCTTASTSVNALGTSAYGRIYKVGVVTVSATGDSCYAIKLPTPAAGAEITFILSSNTGTPSSEAKAGFMFISSDAIYASGAAHDKFHPAGASGGSSVGELNGEIVRFIGDGTYWYPMVNNEQCASKATPAAGS